MSNYSQDCTPDTVGRVFAEVQWGETLRLNKAQEKRLETAIKYPLIKPKIKNKKFVQQQPVVLCECEKVVVPIEKEKKIIDRCTLNRRQHIELLAQPKTQPQCVSVQILKIKEKPKSCCIPPRYLHLAVPNARRVLHNWRDYCNVLSPEHMTIYKNILKRRDALTMREANTYFKLLAAQRKKEKRKQRKLQMQKICCGGAKARRDIDKVVHTVLKYFTRKTLCEVKHRHIIITNEIIKRVAGKSLRKYVKRSNKDVCSRVLYQIVDQLSVWLDNKVDEVDTVDLEGEEEAPSLSTSATDSSLTDSEALISGALLHPKKPKRPKKVVAVVKPLPPKGEAESSVTLEFSVETEEVEEGYYEGGLSEEGRETESKETEEGRETEEGKETEEGERMEEGEEFLEAGEEADT